jgi:hypothetical protein
MSAPAMSCNASSGASRPLISEDNCSDNTKSLDSQKDTTASSLPQVEPPTVAAYGTRFTDKNSTTGLTFRSHPGEWFTDPEHTLSVTEMSRDSFPLLKAWVVHVQEDASPESCLARKCTAFLLYEKEEDLPLLDIGLITIV